MHCDDSLVTRLSFYGERERFCEGNMRINMSDGFGPTVKFKAAILNPPELPEYKSDGAAGMDLCSAEEVTIWPGKAVRVSTGYEIEISSGFEGQVRPRSGLASKHMITVLNSPGTIDEDYRGLLQVLLINLGEKPFVVNFGDRIAQLVIAPVSRAKIELVNSLSETIRGSDGFGSTGINQ